MLVFWLLAVLMTAVALAFVLVPLLRARPVTGPSTLEANLDVLRSQRREIDADVANGTLPPEARDEALAELVRRADSDLAPGATPTLAPRKPWATAAIIALALPACAFGLYLVRGTPGAADPRMANGGMPVDEKQIVAMVDTLARKVRERPDDVQGWALLARSTATLGRFRESADAYEHLARIAPNDPSVLADYADTLAMAQGKVLAGKPYELARQALSIDPTHPKALAIAASAALEANDYATSIGYWKKLEAQLAPDSEDMQQVRAIIDDVESRAKGAGKGVAAASGTAPPAAAAQAAPAGKSVMGSVTAGPAVGMRIQPGDTLFVYARAENGPRMPLAIVRASARDLPLAFTLDDSQAMSPATRLSSAAAVRIEARVSRSGNAMPQPGDIVGQSPVVAPGARGVKIVLDKVLP